MPQVIDYRSNFTSGEITPETFARSDQDWYKNSLRTAENVFIRQHGGVSRRPGTVYVASAKNPGKKAILVPFIYDADTSFQVEIGDLYMRFYTANAQVAGPYELVAPWTEAQLPDLDYSQYDFGMVFSHGDVPQYILRKSSVGSTFTLTQVVYGVAPYEELGHLGTVVGTLSLATVGAGRTLTATGMFQPSDVGRGVTNDLGVAEITAYTSANQVTVTILTAFASTTLNVNEWQIDSSPVTNCTPSAASPEGAVCTLTLAVGGWRTTDVGSFVEINDGTVQITAYTSALQVTGVIQRVLTGTTVANAGVWSINQSVWTAVYGYPRTVTFFEQRLICGGTRKFPQRVWGSYTGETFNFLRGSGDSESFSFNITSDDNHEIRAMSPMRQLIVLTNNAEFSIGGGIEKPLAPSNVQIRVQSVHGSEKVRPTRSGITTFNVTRSGKKIRAIQYEFNNDSFVAPDITIRSSHVTGNGLDQLVFREEPIPWLVGLRADDGVLAACTYDAEQNVFGWTRFVTDGAIEAVSVIQYLKKDTIWAIVRRVVNGNTVRYVERFEETYFTDSAVQAVSGPGTATWTGLNHLEAKQISVLADGVPMGLFTVTAGQVVLPRTANSFEGGLPYTPKINLLPPDIPVPQSGRSSRLSIDETRILFKDTVGCNVNGDVLSFNTIAPPLGVPPAPFSGWKKISIMGWNDGEIEMELTQPQPLPWTILGIAMRLTVNN